MGRLRRDRRQWASLAEFNLPYRALRYLRADCLGTLLVIILLTQKLGVIVGCQFKRIKGRLGRRPSGYGLTGRLSSRSSKSEG